MRRNIFLDVEVDNRSFKKVSKFKYLGVILTYYNDTKVEINTRLIVVATMVWDIW